MLGVETNIIKLSSAIRNKEMRKFMNLTGQVFGRLTVISRIRGPRLVTWICLCSCGKQSAVVSSHLTLGRTKSCGCLRKELTAKRSTTHGMYGSSERNTWALMKKRCLNPNDPNYENYGARGIDICEKWLKFTGFIEDMGIKPTPELTIERLDNNKGYYNSNCVWATRTQQSRNQRVRHDNKSGLSGVRKRKNGNWQSRIGVNGKLIYLGTFDNLLDAACARKSAENKLWRNHRSGGGDER